MESILFKQAKKQLRALPEDKQQEVLDFITFLYERVQVKHSPIVEAEKSQRIKETLHKLAELKTFAEIADPVAWQKEIRQDRPLLE